MLLLKENKWKSRKRKPRNEELSKTLKQQRQGPLLERDKQLKTDTAAF
jgi:hypothetical protein